MRKKSYLESETDIEFAIFNRTNESQPNLENKTFFFPIQSLRKLFVGDKSTAKTFFPTDKKMCIENGQSQFV